MPDISWLDENYRYVTEWHFRRHNIIENRTPLFRRVDALKKNPKATPKEYRAMAKELAGLKTKKRHEKITNEQMLDTLNDNPDSVHWSEEKWGRHLGRSKSTIHSQPAWKKIQEMRQKLKAERLESERKQRQEPD